MGHKDLGGKTVLFVVDALFAGSEANDPPRKFSMAPFNKDWTSSVFVSQDQVARESVCYDFLKSEFTSTNPYGSHPQIEGSDDHILQAADSSYWPRGIRYDPENDGTVIGSLGVCEHWSNAIDKQYTRNLGTGAGIELVALNKTATAVRDAEATPPKAFSLFQNYPTPFNPTTAISFQLPAVSVAKLKIVDMSGKEIATLVNGTMSAGTHVLLIPFLLGQFVTIPPALLAETHRSFYWIALAIPFVMLQGAFRAVPMAVQRFDLFNIMLGASGLLQWGGSLLLVLLGTGLFEIALLTLAIRVVGAFVAYWIAHVLFPKLSVKEVIKVLQTAKKLVGFGGWLTVSQFVSPVTRYLDRAFVVSYHSLRMFTFYSVPYEAMSRLQVIPLSLSTTLFPAMSERESIRGQAESSSLYMIIMRKI